MTEELILEIGYQVLKQYRRPHCLVWLADNGWAGCFEFTAVPHDQGTMIRAYPWPHGTIVVDFWGLN